MSAPVRLARREAGTGGTPLVIAHGLFGSARNWGVVAKRLSDRGRTVAVDLRNHGESPHSDEAGYDAMAADLLAVIEELGGPVDLMGHSMGGKAAMLAALERPDAVRRLVVLDIAPEGYPHAGEQRRLVEAMEGIDLARMSTRAEADAALAGAVPDPSVRSFLLQSLDVRGGRWALNLPALGAAMEDITGWPMDASGAFEGPALFLAGGESDYLAPARRSGIAHYFPNAEVREVADAGHWVHAEAPREVEREVRAFLDSE